MTFFTYKARELAGKTVTGLVEAPSAVAATKLLHEKQLFIISITQSKSNAAGGGRSESYFQRIPFNDIVNFTRQLSTMIVAGLSLPEALSILKRQSSNKTLQTVLTDIEHQIVSGGNLGDSLSKYPRYFSPIYIALIRAGESSGQLDTVFSRLADTLERQRDFNSKVTGAMIYPVIIVVAMAIVVMVMMTFVVPKLTELYKDFGIDLPASTQMLMNASGFFVKFWWLLLFGAFGAVAGYKKWRKTPMGENIMDTVLLKIPLFGELQKKVILVEFTRTLAMLISSGIRLLDALEILKNALANVLFRNAITQISKKVERGAPLGETFAEYAIFPPIVSQMIRVGEETGKLDDTLLKLSKYFESESENLVKGLTTAIEPIIMVVLGVGVGFIVVSIITPIYGLTSQLK